MRLMEVTLVNPNENTAQLRINPLLLKTCGDLPGKPGAPVTARSAIFTLADEEPLYVLQDSREVAVEWAAAMQPSVQIFREDRA